MPTDKTALFTEVVLSVFQANGRLIDWGDKFVAEFGLTSSRWQMLGAVALSQDPLTAPQLAINMGVTRQGAQKQLNLLRQENLVSTLPNPYHKTSPRYTLTPAGAEVYRSVEQKWLAHAKKLCTNISKNDLMVTERILTLLVKSHSIESIGHES